MLLSLSGKILNHMVIHAVMFHMLNLAFKKEINNLQKQIQSSMGNIFWNQPNCTILVFLIIT